MSKNRFSTFSKLSNLGKVSAFIAFVTLFEPLFASGVLQIAMFSAFYVTIPLGIVGIICAIVGEKGRARNVLIALNAVFGLLSPIIMFFCVMTFFRVAFWVTGGQWPPADFG